MRLGEDEALGLGLGGEEEQIRRLIEQGSRSRAWLPTRRIRPTAGLAARRRSASV